MKIEMPDNNTVIINDGDMTVSAVEFGGYVLGYGNGNIPTWSSAGILPHEQQEQEETVSDDDLYDPMRYMSGGNLLTVKQSSERAMYKVYHDIWLKFSPDAIGPIDMLRESISDMIREGMGRQSVYSLAGGIKKGVGEGMYKGVPLAYVFKGFVDGIISSPEEVTAGSGQ